MNQSSFTVTSLKKLLIPLPALETQKKIANTLDKASELIEKRKLQIEKLDLLVKSKFIEVFGDPVTNPMDWEIGTIEQLSKKIQYGTSKKANSNKVGIPIIRMNNITYSGNMNFKDLKYIELDEKEKEKFLVFEKELLFNRTNSKELVGKTAVYNKKFPMAYAGYLIKVVPNEKANAEFISKFLNSKYEKSLLFSMAKNIVGMANINAKELSNIKIYIPPVELQNQFAEFVKKVEAEKNLLEQGLIKLETNYKSLMQKCFNGEIY